MPQSRRGFFAAIVLSLAALPLGHAQDAAPPPQAFEEVTSAGVEAAIAELEGAAIDADVRQSALGLLREALEQLKKADELAGQAVEFGRLAAEAPPLIETLRADLGKPAPTDVEPNVPADATLQQVEQSLSQARADLEAARRRASELQSESDRRATRRTAIPDQIAAARQRLASLIESLGVPRSTQEAPEVANARRVLLLARKAATERELEAAEKEATSYDARRELLPLRRDMALRQVTEAERLAAAWERVAQRRRTAEADLATREAQRQRHEAAQQHPALRAMAESNEALAAGRSGPDGVSTRIAQVNAAIASTQERLHTVRNQFRAMRRRMEGSGLTKATGVLLRREYEALVHLSTLRRQARAVRRDMNDAEYDLVALEEERFAGDVDGSVAALREAVGVAWTTDMESIARDLATARRDLLEQVIGDYTTYFGRLNELDIASRALLEANEAYRSYIEERVLWVRSVGGETLPDPVKAASAGAWLLDGSEWRLAFNESVRDVRRNWGWVVVAGAALLALFASRWRWRRRLVACAPLVTSLRTDRFAHTARAILYTLLVASPLPAALFVIGWLLRRPVDQVAVAMAAGMGLQTAAGYLFGLEILRQVVRPQGLAEAHFRWAPGSVELVRRHLRWFTPAAVSVLFVVVAMDRQTASEAWNDSLGRIAFTAAMVLLAIFVHFVLRPGAPLVAEYIRRRRGGWVERLRYVWYPLAVCVPLLLVGLTLTGYYYTAFRLERQLATTVWLVTGLVLLNAVLMRWLFTARRRLMLETRKRERARAERSGSIEAVPQPSDQHEPDIPTIDAQTQRLFRTAAALTLIIAMYAIWADVLPALRMLDRVQVWPLPPAIVQIESDAPPAFAQNGAQTPTGSPAAPATPSAGTATPTPTPTPMGPAAATPAATPGPLAEETRTVLTLADFGLMLVILLVTAAAVRNLPALVEIVVLQRLPLDAGSRYALSTIVRYVILIVGLVAAFSALGVAWSKVQWIVAALTFGLAFGLQEIFANFISGLIILAERPVRVGDAVTVGGISGTVSRIRMRATTITDWDRKELIVPNKAFVTDQVINWTLSDPVLRLTVPVGVAYGSDVDLVQETLLGVARADDIVLSEPAPQALFLGFGDSTLNFELRVFLPHIEHLMPTRHRMHRAIAKAFQAANIEIAFPQRDLHVRSAEALKDLVHKREGLPESEISGLR